MEIPLSALSLRWALPRMRTEAGLSGAGLIGMDSIRLMGESMGTRGGARAWIEERSSNVG